MRLAVCICTHRRPEGLSRTLQALGLLAQSQPFEVFVVDNHPAEEGLKAVADIQAQGYPVPLQALAVPVGGISEARNRVLDLALEAGADFAALIDDDEWPDAQWLEHLLRVQALDDADAVGGPTRPVFEQKVSEQLANCIYYGADLGLEDNANCELQACGNVLLKLSTVRELQAPYFDPALGQSGGEDLQFFMRLRAAGATMRWAKHATVFESVPANRCSEDWLKQRVALIANTRVHIMARCAGGWTGRLSRGAKTIALGLHTGLCKVAAQLMPQRRFEAMLLQAKFTGKVRAHLGLRMLRGENH